MRVLSRGLLAFFFVMAASGVLCPAASHGGTFFWSNPSGGQWTEPSNWGSTTYPQFLWDFAMFGVPGSYEVDATDASRISAVGGILIASGDLVLRTHEGFAAVLLVGGSGSAASLTLASGAVSASAVHQVRDGGTLLLGPGTRISSSAGGPFGFDVDPGGFLGGSGASLDGQCLRNQGTVSPGLPPEEAGVLTIGSVSPGAFHQQASGTLLIQLGGTEPGVDHDQLRVEQADAPVVLDGTLRVELMPGYEPGDNARFDVFVAPSYVGAFSTVEMPEVDGLSFEVIYEPDRVSIVVSAIASFFPVAMDVRPGDGCDDRFNPRTKGVLPVALLGSAAVPVSRIDPASLRLEGAAPLRHAFEDVSGPMTNAYCGCFDGPDGIGDLVLKFRATEVAAAVGKVSTGEVLMLRLSGKLDDGTMFTSEDCVVITGRRPPPKSRRKQETTGLEAQRLWLGSPSGPSGRQEIRFGLPRAASTMLHAYDVAGRLVASWGPEDRPAGEYSVIWTADGASSGVYFFRLYAGGEVARLKRVLMR